MVAAMSTKYYLHLTVNIYTTRNKIMSSASAVRVTDITQKRAGEKCTPQLFLDIIVKNGGRVVSSMRV
jgi:hypothetical protein